MHVLLRICSTCIDLFYMHRSNQIECSCNGVHMHVWLFYMHRSNQIECSCNGVQHACVAVVLCGARPVINHKGHPCRTCGASRHQNAMELMPTLMPTRIPAPIPTLTFFASTTSGRTNMHKYVVHPVSMYRAAMPRTALQPPNACITCACQCMQLYHSGTWCVCMQYYTACLHTTIHMCLRVDLDDCMRRATDCLLQSAHVYRLDPDPCSLHHQAAPLPAPHAHVLACASSKRCRSTKK